MKKIYLFAASLMLTAGAMAQTTTTLTAHYAPVIASSNFTYYNIGPNGYLTGNDAFGSETVVQLFDSNYGVNATGTGTIDSLSIWIPMKRQFGGGTLKVGVWTDVAGVPSATPLEVVTLNMSAVDTSIAAIKIIRTAGIPTGVYNVRVALTSAIPANHKFWAGLVLPTTAGDTAVVMGCKTTYAFADSATHVGEYDGSAFLNYGDASGYGLSQTLAIFPTVTQTVVTTGIAENTLKVSVYPNPANSLLNFNMAVEGSSISIMSTDGKIVSTTSMSGLNASVDVSALKSGMYFYTVTSANGMSVRNSFVKN